MQKMQMISNLYLILKKCRRLSIKQLIQQVKMNMKSSHTFTTRDIFRTLMENRRIIARTHKYILNTWTKMLYVRQQLSSIYLVNFLYEREKPYDGILQKFVSPKGNHNCNIKSLYLN
jgi:hypothetical protein